MKKFFFLLSSISCVSAHTMDFNTLLNKPKISYQNIKGSFNRYDYEFQINLKENQTKLSTELSPYMGLYTHIPAIGFYGNPYQFASRLTLVELDPRMIIQALPQTLKQSLINSLAPGKTFQDILASKTVYANIMISGFIPGKSIYNLVFHPFGYSFIKKLLFNINISMGVFNPDGVTNISIAFETFKTENVNAHNGRDLALSPNNARIAITPYRSVSTFWSAAYSPDKKNITITYHIMANDQTTQSSIEKIIKDAVNLGDLLNSMATMKDTLANNNDKQSLGNAIDTIRSILKWKEIQQVHELSTTLNQLTTQLKNLEQQLEKTLKKG